MKITKYEQSCFLIEEGDTRILIDPGMLSTNRPVEEYGKLDVVIYTHLHPDHFDPNIFEKLAENNVPAYLNQTHYEANANRGNIVNDQDEFSIGHIKIRAIELPHCLMFDGTEGPQNTGYLFNDKFFDPGDGKELAGVTVEILALPIAGPDISMRDSFSFANQVGAKIAIPIHYETLGAKPDVFKSFTERFNQPYEVKVLNIGESIEF